MAWEAEPRTTRDGQPRYSALAINTGLTLLSVFRLALRQTEGLIGSIMTLLGPDLAVPDRSALSRRAETLEVPPWQPGAGSMHLLGGAGEWLVEKHGSRLRRSWRKLHVGVDAETGRIVAAEVTAPDLDDASPVGRFLDQVAGPIASFTADGAYDRDGVDDDVAARHPGADVIVRPRSRAVPGAMAERHPPGETNTGRPSPDVAAWAGRKPQATTGVPWSKRIFRASNGPLAAGCARARPGATQQRWPSPSVR